MPIQNPTFQSFSSLFLKATDCAAYSYQVRLADQQSFPQALIGPTGIGKTDAVVLSWLWRRRFHPEEAVRNRTPRRLVYCLPQRVLVEQMRDTVISILINLELYSNPQHGVVDSDHGIGVHILMGGDLDESWQLYPERDVIIIGTQDMLLSRALNRGYLLNRFGWPIDFGLLNNDALWIMDEVQLMGAGITTSAQLDAFRTNIGAFGTFNTLWMSATLQRNWLHTVDRPNLDDEEIFILNSKDMNEPRITKLLHTNKCLNQLSLSSKPESKTYPTALAKKVIELHQPGTTSIVIINTVNRAKALYNALENHMKSSRKRNDKVINEQKPELILLHSRFRPLERRQIINTILKPVDVASSGRIIVSTQVLEAGVDISSATLFTELAPWASMVQRFGRCNRYGEYEFAWVFWIDVLNKTAFPYNVEEMIVARQVLNELEEKSVAPADLPEVEMPIDDYDVIRRRDLYDLFDTMPDLSGNDVDVSRFIRVGEDKDIWVCWREWHEKYMPAVNWPKPLKEELCPVSIGEFRQFFKGLTGQAWTWDYFDGRWRYLASDDLWPGQVVVINAKAGGYNPDIGWNPEGKQEVPVIPLDKGFPDEAMGDDRLTVVSTYWQSIIEHSQAVYDELDTVLSALPNLKLDRFKNDLKLSALLHDLGKSHPIFQQTMMVDLNEEELEYRRQVLWAKRRNTQGRAFRHSRRHFRHELASLLTLIKLENELKAKGVHINDLVMYLVASHHGRIRVAIRSLPGQKLGYENGEVLSIMGIQEGDIVPELNVGHGIIIPSVELSLDAVQIGEGAEGASWLSRSLSLRDNHEIGPFRLAYLEALLRAADARASYRFEEEGGRSE